MTDYKMIEEFPVSTNPMVVVKWIGKIKQAEDEEVHIENKRRGRWVVLRMEEDPDALFLTNYEVVLKFDDVETDGRRLIFFLRELEICSMYPMIGWIARRVMV